MNNKKRISYRLSISILSTTVIVFSVIVVLNYNFSKRMLMQHIEDSAINKSGLIISQMAKHIVTAQEITRNVANQAVYYYRHNDLEYFLKNVMKANPALTGIHVYLKPDSVTRQRSACFSACKVSDSIVCSNSCDQHIVNQTDLHKHIEQTPGGFWTDPYLNGRTDSLYIISYVFPIRLPGTNRIAGNVSGEVALKYINQLVSGTKIGKNGIAFVIDKSGLFLTHPVSKWILKKNFFNLPEKVRPEYIPEIKKIVGNGQYGISYGHPAYYNYQKTWIYFAPMPSTNWTVVILIPEKELFHDLWLIFREIGLVAIIGIIVIFFLFTLIFRQTFNPLEKITRDIQQFIFEGKKSNTKNEIETLTKSLEEIQIRYDQFQQEQDQNQKNIRRFEKEMKSAKEIQQNLIPSGYPAFPDHEEEIDLYAVLKPAEKIGGDLYDYFFIDQSHLLFAIGDVSGKGIPASLFMAVAHTLIKSNSDILSSQHIIDLINKKLSNRNVNQHFLTIFLGILDVENGILDYCNAAHNYPYILRNSGKIEMLDKTQGLPVGIYPNKTYSSSTTVLKSGDSIFLYTDGVIDCRDGNDNIYGMQRLEESLQKLQGLTCIKMVTKIENDLRLFKGNTVQADDISLMALCYKGHNRG